MFTWHYTWSLATHSITKLLSNITHFTHCPIANLEWQLQKIKKTKLVGFKNTGGTQAVNRISFKSDYTYLLESKIYIMYQTRIHVAEYIHTALLSSGNFSILLHSHLIVPLTWFCHSPSASLMADEGLPLQLLWEPWHALNRAIFGMCCSCLAHWCQGLAISIQLSKKAGIRGFKVTSACSSSCTCVSEKSV